MKDSKKTSIAQASFNTIRVGKKYQLTNHGETSQFTVLEIINANDCLVRSLDTMETFHLDDLVKYGQGKDFEFDEL